MSGFSKLFGKDTIQNLRDTEEILKKRQDFLEQKISKELLIAKQNGIRNKRVALQALKRKKRYQQHLARIDGILCNIENQREALENASTNREVLDTMSTAAAALKMAHQNMDTDRIDKLMTEITEQQEIEHEISDAISTPIGFADDIDEVPPNFNILQHITISFNKVCLLISLLRRLPPISGALTAGSESLFFIYWISVKMSSVFVLSCCKQISLWVIEKSRKMTPFIG
uniref:Charged multivesicular body protein 4Bb n=1 Tax=Erpetoichthys calabaricus TaxID=27687 RepID=A0A8C4SLH5_ERPCA